VSLLLIDIYSSLTSSYSSGSALGSIAMSKSTLDRGKTGVGSV
jgi:hypothetical protein